MRTATPERILQIIADIEASGNVPLTRLTVLKKRLEHPGRLEALGLWIARKAAGRKGRTKGAAGALLDEARALLGATSTHASFHARPDPAAARSLHDRARAFQSDYKRLEWGPVRLIHSTPLLLVEEGLALVLGLARTPSDGCRLAVKFAENYDPKYGNGLNGPSRGKLEELVRWMFSLEALED